MVFRPAFCPLRWPCVSSCFYWRSLRDSNSCYSLERALSKQHRTTLHDRKHLENSLFSNTCPIASVLIRVRLVDIVDTTISRVQ
jgi:hypothetical protein